MSATRTLDLQNVFMELSVISLIDNEQEDESIRDVLNAIDNSKLFLNERTRNGACIEGAWKDVSALIETCYQRIQTRSPRSYLRITIR
ncbi:MAG: hypothetical protein ACOYYS_20535 [Chloroflexota bacterium]